MKLFYYSRLSTEQLKEYLIFLLDNGLIRVDRSTGHPVLPSRGRIMTRRGDLYHITDKGLKYLALYKEMQQGISI
jgi:predicted transcriptional regulator